MYSGAYPRGWCRGRAPPGSKKEKKRRKEKTEKEGKRKKGKKNKNQEKGKEGGGDKENKNKKMLKMSTYSIKRWCRSWGEGPCLGRIFKL